jgi:AcrR family transcriptional regulator
VTENVIQAHKAEAVGAKLFARHGYSATTTRALSRSLGITNGTFYHHYANKEALLLQICRSSLEHITTAVTEAVAVVNEPMEKLHALIGTHIREMLRDQDLHKTMLIELRSLSGGNLEEVTQRRDWYSEVVRDVIRAAQGAEVLRSDLDSHTLSLLLLNLLNWTIFWYDAGGELSPEDLSEATVKMFIDGARAVTR